MILSSIDWVIITIFFVVVLGIGWYASKTAGKNSSEFFLGGRGMPWWLLGVSMVACTFSADTPNLVTGMVRENGVAKNWAWWAFLITGMVTVFIYAKLWRRSNVMTDMEFYELRYSGKPARFLRVFRSLYLGILFNCLIMGTVTLAAIKIGAVMFDLPPWITVVGGSVAVVLYAAIGGLKGVIWADFFQYGIAMGGALLAAIYSVDYVTEQGIADGLSGVLSHPNLIGKLDILPDFSNPSNWIPLLLIPLAVQWWAAWYPGAEPGGGGYIAQRMLAAKDEKNAIGATLFFNFMHYALRPWPWIIVALVSLIVFPDLESIRDIAPGITDTYLKDDVAYPAMLKMVLPSGMLGLVMASLIGAYMSTIGTHLNWGSSYFVNDFYKRLIKPEASEKELVFIGRIATISLMILSGIVALTVLSDATQAFNMLILAGAGSGAIYLFRWFWWRINAWSEIVAIIVATILAIVLTFGVDDEILKVDFGNGLILEGGTIKFLLETLITSFTWILTTLITKPESTETLRNYYRLIRPGGPGWKKVIEQAERDGDFINEKEAGKKWEMPLQVLCVFIGCVTIYCCLFSIGNFIYGKHLLATILLLIALAGTVFLFKSFNKLRAD